MSNEKLLKEQEVAKILEVSLATLRRWRWIKTGPVYLKFAKSVRYRYSDLETYMAASVVVPSTNRAAA